MQTEELLPIVIGALKEKKGNRISVLNVGKVSPVCDYFVIVSGSNVNQVDAMADSVEELLHKNDITIRGVEGDARGGWILIDCYDIVVHIFTEEMREFYQLERSWKDAGSTLY